MTVIADWVAALTAQTYPSTDQYLHTPFGFDPLGVLCEQFRHSSYTLLTGQGTVAVGLLQDISDARNAVSQALQDDGFPFPVHATELADAIAASFWATDLIVEADKLLVKTWRDAIDAERSRFILASLADPGSEVVTAALATYQTAISLWEEWLGTLSSPGGWRTFLLDWETAPWVLDTGRSFYTLNGISTKLPEAVQRWAELFEADPVIILTGDSDYGTDVRAPLNLVVDGLIRKKVGNTYRAYTEAEIIDLMTPLVPTPPVISPSSFSFTTFSTPPIQFTAVPPENISWSTVGGTIDGSGLYSGVESGVSTVRATNTLTGLWSEVSGTVVLGSPPHGGGGGGGN